MLSLSGEVYVFKKLTTLTGGEFCVPESASSIHEFFQHHVQPPQSIEEEDNNDDEVLSSSNNNNIAIRVKTEEERQQQSASSTTTSKGTRPGIVSDRMLVGFPPREQTSVCKITFKNEMKFMIMISKST